MAYKVTNNAFSTLNGSISNSATSLNVATGHGDRFPVVTGADYTYVTLEDSAGNIEVVKVTARASTSDTMTIVRGQDGTSGRNWASGDIVELRIVALLLDSALTHIDDVTNAHVASSIGFTPAGAIVATNVQSALQELDSDLTVTIGSVNTVSSNLTAHIGLATDAHDASAISYLGSANLSSANVEAALDELDTEKASIVSIQNQSATAFTTGGTSSAFTVTANPALTTYTNSRLAVTLNAMPTGSPTINYNGLGAKSFKYKDSTGAKQFVTSTQALSGHLCDLWYDGTDVLLLNPLPSSETTVANFTAVSASNTLTFTVQPTLFNFRNATLNSGVPQLVASALATLAAPAGATFGAPAAITSASATMAGTTTLTINTAPTAPIQIGAVIFQAGTRIGKVASLGTYVGGAGTGTVILDASATFTAQAIVIINPVWLVGVQMANGELAVINQAGAFGVNKLDETGLISTTAIGAGSTSATTFYSTTARTNQPYKVIFMAQVAQATVGTYAIQPEQVFAISGSGYAAMMSVGVGQSYQDVSNQRVAGQTYRNLENKPKIVCVNAQLPTSSNTSINVNGLATVQTVSNNAATPSAASYAIPIPPGHTFIVSFVGSTSAIWSELQ
jgi:hypothetical protein